MGDTFLQRANALNADTGFLTRANQQQLIIPDEIDPLKQVLAPEVTAPAASTDVDITFQPKPQTILPAIAESGRRLQEELEIGTLDFDKITEPIRALVATEQDPEGFVDVATNFVKEVASTPFVAADIAKTALSQEDVLGIPGSRYVMAPITLATEFANFFIDRASTLLTAAQLNPITQAGVAIGNPESIAELREAQRSVAASPFFTFAGAMGLLKPAVKGAKAPTPAEISKVAREAPTEIRKQLKSEIDSGEIKIPKRELRNEATIVIEDPKTPSNPTVETAQTNAQAEIVFRDIQEPGVPAEKGTFTPETKTLTLAETASPDVGIENFFGRTNKITTPTTKLKKAAAAVKLGFRERFVFAPKLPDIPEAALARDMVRTMPEQIRSAQNKAISDISNYLEGTGGRGPLDAANLDVVRRKIFNEDLLSESNRAVQEGKAPETRLPDGVSVEGLKTELNRLDGLIKESPAIGDAISTRNELWNLVGKDLVDRGVLGPEVLDNPVYIRHFVLDYMEQQPGTVRQKKLQAPYRAYSKERKGTNRDISTDFLEVELKALSDVYADNAIQDLAEQIGVQYGKKAPSNGGAVLPGHVEWQFQRGNAFYKALTITDADMAKLLGELTELDGILQVPASYVKEAMVVGGKRKTHYIPDWLADQLNDLPVQHKAGTVVSFTKPFVQTWKRWILRVNPIRYNKRNAIGDGERVNAGGYTASFLKVPQAVDMLTKRQGVEFEKGVEFGAFGSSLWHEMGTARQLVEFEQFKAVDSKSAWDSAINTIAWPGKQLSRAGQVIQDATQFREDILRGSVYLEALERVNTHIRTGEPLQHWPGFKDDIMVIAKADPFRAAAKMSREVLGDYGAFTPWENNTLRQGIAPFYSWMKINTVFWPRTFKNALLDGNTAAVKQSAAVRAARVGANGIKWTARVGAAYAALNAWNNHNDEFAKREAALRPFQKMRPHILTEDSIISDPTALSDFMEWFGLDDIAPEITRHSRGQIDGAELTQNIMKSVAKAPVNRIVGSLSPFIKEPIARVAFGSQVFPDIFDAREYHDAFTSRAVADAVLNILGSDVKKFVDVGKGKRSLREVLSYYFSGSSYRPLTAEQLEKEILRSIDALTLKGASATTGRQPGEAKAGRDAEVDILLNRLQSLRGQQ